MSVQDKLERTLRDIHVMISRGREEIGRASCRERV